MQTDNPHSEQSFFPVHVHLLFHALLLVGMAVLAFLNVKEGSWLFFAANVSIIACLLISLAMIARGKLQASVNFLLAFAVLPPTVLLIVSVHQGDRPGYFVIPHLMTMMILSGLFLDKLRLVWLVVGYAVGSAVVHEVFLARAGLFTPASAGNVAIFLALAAAGAITLASTKNRLVAERNRADASTKAKGEFLARMTHEIRTPLSGARGIAGLARSTGSDTERARLLEQLEGTLHHMRSIVDDILDFEKMEAVGLSLDARPFTLPSVIEDVVSLFRPVADQKGVKLRAKIDARTPTRVLGDARRLRQVLYNLTHNALKFTTEGHVTVTCNIVTDDSGEDHQTVRLAVFDTGEGMTNETAESLFSAYASTDAPDQHPIFGDSGTGLGLEISRHLVSLMGGSFGVRSEVGKGSEFSFDVTFPVVKEREGRSEPTPNDQEQGASSLPQLLGGREALLAEDDAINLMVAEKLLSTAGFEPILARDGREAVELYQRYRPALLLMDNEMPRLNGTQAIREIRMAERDRNDRRATIIALTAYVDADGAAALRDAGADEIILKPLALARLESVLRSRYSSLPA